jgi:hypothetical protein
MMDRCLQNHPVEGHEVQTIQRKQILVLQPILWGEEIQYHLYGEEGRGMGAPVLW